MAKALSSSVPIFHNGLLNPLSPDVAAEVLASSPACIVDIGTGDGRFIYEQARDNPATTFVGVDTCLDNIKAILGKMRRKMKLPRPNLLLVRSPANDLPQELERKATGITVQFPWGSLLTDLVTCESGLYDQFARTASEKCSLRLLVNYAVFEAADLKDRLELPDLDEEYIETSLKPALEKRGFAIRRRKLIPPGSSLPVKTTWGQRLTRGSRRNTLLIEADRVS